MGAILNNLRTPEIDSLENMPTNSADWLTSHADATGLAVVEIERLWHRFQLLTGSNDAGVLLPNSISDDVRTDLFVRNVSDGFFPFLLEDERFFSSSNIFLAPNQIQVPYRSGTLSW